jgi:hypothetical protein
LSVLVFKRGSVHIVVFQIVDVYVDKKTSLEGNESIMENDELPKAQVWGSNSTT